MTDRCNRSDDGQPNGHEVKRLAGREDYSPLGMMSDRGAAGAACILAAVNQLEDAPKVLVGVGSGVGDDMKIGLLSSRIQ